MPIELTMPRLSDTMEAGTIIKWNVKEGAKVKSGDVVADIETDKATMEMQAFDDGTIAKLLVPEGQAVPVGTVIAVIAEAGEDAGAIASSAAVAEPAAKSAAAVVKKPVEIETGLSVEAASAAKAMTGPGSLVTPPRSTVQRIAQPVSQTNDDADGRFRISPVARHLADEQHRPAHRSTSVPNE